MPIVRCVSFCRKADEETTSATTRFLYAGSQVIAEYDGSNAPQRRFVAGGLDEPLVWLEGTARRVLSFLCR
jgi:hypothetical protein